MVIENLPTRRMDLSYKKNYQNRIIKKDYFFARRVFAPLKAANIFPEILLVEMTFTVNKN